MKTKISLLVLLLAITFSCKDENASVEKDKQPAAVEVKNEIVLSNYSDENWDKGVGITFKMFLVDNTPEQLQLIKGGKELVLSDGTKLAYVGYEEKGGFIQVFITEDAKKYASVAQHPNVIRVN